jgi:hypothetical protein
VQSIAEEVIHAEEFQSDSAVIFRDARIGGKDRDNRRISHPAKQDGTEQQEGRRQQYKVAGSYLKT